MPSAIGAIVRRMAGIQTWVALVGGLATAILGILKYFNYRTRTDRLVLVGQTFSETVDALAAKDEIKRLAAAILLRRFFDPHTEQGSGRTPYQKEALRVIAALLRATTQESEFQKLLADGLGHAPDLHGADLQGCNLSGAYLGDRLGRRVDISGADLYKANLSRTSLRGAIAERQSSTAPPWRTRCSRAPTCRPPIFARPIWQRLDSVTRSSRGHASKELGTCRPTSPPGSRLPAHRDSGLPLVPLVRPRGRARRRSTLRRADWRRPRGVVRRGQAPARNGLVEGRAMRDRPLQRPGPPRER